MNWFNTLLQQTISALQFNQITESFFDSFTIRCGQKFNGVLHDHADAVKTATKRRVCVIMSSSSSSSAAAEACH